MLEVDAGEDRWFVGTVRAGAADLAVLHLKRQPESFLDVFSPTVAEERLEGRQKRRVVRDLRLYPGYVFVKFNPHRERWRSFNGTVGCGKLLGANSDNLPLALPRGFVEELQGLQAGGLLTAVRADAVVHHFVKDQSVLVRSGSWAGHTGEFSRYRKGSLVLFMTLFSQRVELEFKPHECQPAPPKAA